MVFDRLFQRAWFLVLAALIAVTIGAKPLHAVDGASGDVKKVSHEKKNTKSSKAKKPRDTTAPLIGTQYPGEPVHGQGY